MAPEAAPLSSAFFKLLPVTKPPVVAPTPVPTALAKSAVSLVPRAPPSSSASPAYLPPAEERPAVIPETTAPLSGSLPATTALIPPTAAAIAICAGILIPAVAIAAAIGATKAIRSPTVPMPSLESVGPETQRIGPTEPSGLIVRSPCWMSQEAFLPFVSLRFCANLAASTAPSGPSPLNRTLPLRSVTWTGPPRYSKELGACPAMS